MLKYEIVKEEIKNLISQMEADAILPSYKDLAKRYSVSDITVRKALTELVKEDFIYTQRGKGIFAAPIKKKFRDVHIISHFLNTDTRFSNDFYPGILENLQKNFMKHDIDCIYSFHLDEAENERHIIERVINRCPYGVVAIPSGFPANFPLYQKLVNIVPNFVFLDLSIDSIYTNVVSNDSVKLISKMCKDVDFSEYDKAYIIGDDSRRILNNPMSRITTFIKILKERNFMNYEYLSWPDKFEIFKHYLTDYLREDIKNHKKIILFTVNCVLANYICQIIGNELGALDEVLLLTVGKIKFPIPKNTNVIWAEQDMEKQGKCVADIILNNSKQVNKVIADFKYIYKNSKKL